MFQHKKSIFPLILAALTLALIGLMIYSFRSSSQPTEPPTRPQPEPVPTEPQVTDEGYRTELRAVMQGFPQTIVQENSELAQLSTIENTLDEVLAITVPSEYRDLHLQIASNLHLMRQGLKEGTDDFENGMQAIQQLINENDWLQ